MTKALADHYIGVSKRLDDLPSSIKKNISELIFCQRGNEFSVTVITRDYRTFERIAKHVPEDFDRAAPRFGVDLESLGTEKIRLYYALAKGSQSALVGYYWNPQRGAYVEKNYIRNKSGGLTIERRIDGVLSETSEGEVQCDVTEWKGPISVVNISRDNGINMIALKKTHANQTYIRVGDI